MVVHVQREGVCVLLLCKIDRERNMCEMTERERERDTHRERCFL